MAIHMRVRCIWYLFRCGPRPHGKPHQEAGLCSDKRQLAAGRGTLAAKSKLRPTLGCALSPVPMMISGPGHQEGLNWGAGKKTGHDDNPAPARNVYWRCTGRLQAFSEVP